MKAPTLRPDGTCPDCAHGWQCEFHSAQGLVADRRRADALKRASAGLREIELTRICCRHELESDEGGTAREKAARMLPAPTPLRFP